ncbi:MAG: UDP-glucose 4-epimerase [Patiriisocius sp.]|jgi:UDP-glucose 4-epimerase
MDVLVTGGAGYIGSHTIIELINNTDWNPISIDNYSNSTPETYERIKEITGKSVKHYNVNLLNFKELEVVFKENNIQGIIHFAAHKSVPESVQKPLDYYNNNLNSLVNVLQLQKDFDVPYFIFSSSCSVYGSSKDLPVTENTPIGQTECPYAYTKVVGENILMDIAKIQKNQKFIALRYFNPVGAHVSGKIGELPTGVPNNLVPYITQTAVGIREQLTVFGNDYDTVDGTCVRDYIHVSDIAKAHIMALQLLKTKEQDDNFDVFNLGTGKGVSVMQAIEAFEKCAEQKLNYKIGPRREGDIAEVFADTEKSKTILGWEAEKTIDEMMSSAWKWQQYLSSQSL